LGGAEGAGVDVLLAEGTAQTDVVCTINFAAKPLTGKRGELTLLAGNVVLEAVV
jgi:hypothetical protein